MRRRVEGKRVQREHDQQVIIAVALLDEENQGRRYGSQVGRGPNVDRHRHSRGKNLLDNYSLSSPSQPFSQWASASFRWVSLDSLGNPKANPMPVNHGVASLLTQQADLWE
ncbi:PREDICTED: quinone oxidoreductase PIG3 isoform [Prunus dulcis]|uniref:PREDICTED: quinone oxidoreductase PIG3 isoform n=1 Tax=Prunus dulcis TaxID=3755 RepID=A0A5E4FS00_PRUDU|nr:PREDICTED: quinone oxidoreductase PIG3 isoform [Prunus dulcis]